MQLLAHPQKHFKTCIQCRSTLYSVPVGTRQQIAATFQCTHVATTNLST